jgi:4-hydroxybenzoate polyprenyltransferase
VVETARALVLMTRPTTSAAMALLALLCLRLGGDRWEPARLVVLCLGWIVLAGAAFVVNDCFDARIDAVVHPRRPIPAGRIDPALALRLGIGLGLAGIAGLALASWPLGLVAALYAAASWGYSSHLKVRHGVAANVAVAGLVALVPLTMVAAGAGVPPLWIVPAIFLAVLGREVLKDLRDADGDRLAGRLTLPLRVGSRAAGRVAALSWLAFALAAWWPITSPAPRAPGYLVATALLSTGALGIALALLRPRPGALAALQLASKLLLIGQVMLMLAVPGWYR